MPDQPLHARRIDGDDVALSECPPRTCLVLRGRASDARLARAVASATDLALPAAPGDSVAGLLCSLLRLGPDEWWIVSETQGPAELAGSLRSALVGIHAALVDVGDACIVYALRGANARDVLARGCPLDLHPRVFTPGRCTRTLLARAPVLVHLRAAEPSFELYVARSYRDYAWTWLVTAAKSFFLPRGPTAGC